MSRKQKNLLAWLAILFIMIASVVIAVVLVVNLGEAGANGVANVGLDWIEVVCSLLSGAASVILGVVAIVQTEKANKLTEELAEIDRFQYENSVMSQDCPLLKFAKVQVLDKREGSLTLKFVDTKNVPTKAIYVSNVYLYPYLRDDKAKEREVEPLPVQKREKAVKAEFKAYRRKKRGIAGIYEVELKVDVAVFEKYQNYLLEFDMGVINTAEVADVYKYKLLMRTPVGKGEKGNMRGAGKTLKLRGAGKVRRLRRGAGKVRLRVLHQFYEIETVMGEEKFREGLG